MPKPGFRIPTGTVLRPWPGASFEPGDEAALTAALSEAQISAFIASGHLAPDVAAGPTDLRPRVLFVYAGAVESETDFATWEAAYLAALALSPTVLAPVAVKFIDSLMPNSIDRAALASQYIFVSDARGGDVGGLLVIRGGLSLPASLAEGEPFLLRTTPPELWAGPVGGGTPVKVSGGSTKSGYLVVRVTQSGTSYASETLLNTTGRTVAFSHAANQAPAYVTLTWTLSMALDAVAGTATDITSMSVVSRRTLLQPFRASGSSLVFDRATAQLEGDTSTFGVVRMFVFAWDLN